MAEHQAGASFVAVILQAELKAVVRKILTLEREEDNNHDKFAGCYCPLPWSSKVFVGVLALPQAQRDSYL